MSKRKKGVSLEEKRERILNIYHESKDVYNMKEIEKLGAKAGVGTFYYCMSVEQNNSNGLSIVLQTIKDVNQALVDDNLVDFDKVFIIILYCWFFPCDHKSYLLDWCWELFLVFS
jgi:hypothetical protein